MSNAIDRIDLLARARLVTSGYPFPLEDLNTDRLVVY